MLSWSLIVKERKYWKQELKGEVGKRESWLLYFVLNTGVLKHFGSEELNRKRNEDRQNQFPEQTKANEVWDKGGGMGLCFYRKGTHLCCKRMAQWGLGQCRWVGVGRGRHFFLMASFSLWDSWNKVKHSSDELDMQPLRVKEVVSV